MAPNPTWKDPTPYNQFSPNLRRHTRATSLAPPSTGSGAPSMTSRTSYHKSSSDAVAPGSYNVPPTPASPTAVRYPANGASNRISYHNHYAHGTPAPDSYFQ